MGDPASESRAMRRRRRRRFCRLSRFARLPLSPALCAWRPGQRRRLILGGLLAALLWLFWPFLRPLLWPARGPAWLVVLDGYHRLDAALALQRRWRLPILLISCPATGQPTAAQRRQLQGPLERISEGFDTASQMAALGRWQAADPRRSPEVVWLITDDFHLDRARLAAQIALGSGGTRVHGLPVTLPHGSPQNPGPWPLWRDALRLQLWRAGGSTGAFLRPDLLRHKLALCRGSGPG